MLYDKILPFIRSLDLDASLLPQGIHLLNPFRGERADVVRRITEAFYTRFYPDDRPRRFILGINPGRHGAGLTGIPFTDTKRLKEFCGIEVKEFECHEPSSVFVYEMITAYGGPEKFYQDFYINSPSPLGYTRVNENGREVNCNYYDDPAIWAAVKPSAIKWMWEQLGWGLRRDTCFCLGSGKNFKALSKFNDEFHFFEKIVPLEHPRFVAQYKWKERDRYIDDYLTKFWGR